MVRSLVAAAVAGCVLAATLSGATQHAHAAGGTATIYRDAYGVPHVQASDDASLAYATGYAQAQDRLFEATAIRLVAQGRLDELTGSGALPADQVMRRDYYDPADVARQYAAQPQSIKDQLIAFAAGFNRAMQEVLADPARRPALYDALGYTPEPWKPTDSMSVGILFSYANIGGEGGAGQLANAALLDRLIARHGRKAGLRRFNDYLFKRDPRAPTVIPRGHGPKPLAAYLHEHPGPQQIALALRLGPKPLERAARARQAEATTLTALLHKLPIPHWGSYGDALPGGLTRSGGGLLQGSPQTGIDAPSLFWLLGQHDPQRDCTGFTVPGLGPWTGVGWCNDHAWTLITGNLGEQADDYVEQLKPGDEHQYRWHGRWRAMSSRVETYDVNKCVPPLCQQPTPPQTIRQTIWSTVHGPVVYTDPAKRFVVTQRRIQRGAWGRSFAGLDGWNRHRGIDAFNADTDRFTATYNLLYADAAGNAMYRFTGWQPLRAPGIDRRLPTPGDGRYEWTGRVGVRHMPQYATRGRDVLAVNQGTESKPIWWWPNSSSVLVGQASRVAGNQRLLRSLDTGVDVDRFQNDVYPKLLERQDAITPVFASLLRRALRSAADPRLAQALSLFDAWAAAGYPRIDADGDGRYDSPALTIFGADDFNLPASQYPRHLWTALLQRTLSTAELGSFVPAGTGAVQEPMTWLGQLSELKRTLDLRPSRQTDAAVRAALTVTLDRLTNEFKTADMTRWLRPVPTVSFSALGVAAPPPIHGYDHGTYSQIVDPAAGLGRYITPPGEGSADSASQIALAELGQYPKHFDDQRGLYERYGLLTMPHTPQQYETTPESVTVLSYP